jgi:hypothetical protein
LSSNTDNETNDGYLEFKDLKVLYSSNWTASLFLVFRSYMLLRIAMSTAIPREGVYTPLVTFFNEDESIDIPSTLIHAKRMADSGVTGLVLQGSNGEPPRLDHEERNTLLRSIRDHLTELNYRDIQLITGCGAASVRETLLHIGEARELRR